MYKINKTFLTLSIFIALGGFFYFFAAKFHHETPQKLTKVTLRLLWEAQTQFAGYYVAKELGYYKSEGLEVEIVPSLGAGDIIPVVGSGPFEFGVTQLSNLIKAIDDDIPVKGIAQIVQESNLLLITPKSTGITSIQNFKGKTLSSWWGKKDFMIRILLEMNGLKPDDIKTLNETYWSKTPQHADITTVMKYCEFNKLRLEGELNAYNIFAYKDMGLNFPEDVLFTSKNTLELYPHIVETFLRATIKGWRKAISNKELATNIVLKYATSTDYQEQLSQLNIISQAILPRKSASSISDDFIQEEANLLYRYKVTEKFLNVDDIFDNKYMRLTEWNYYE